MSRFGLKIVLAMLLIAVIPLLTSVYLVGEVVNASDRVAEGQSRGLTEPLARAAQAYRQLFRARRRLFALRGETIAADPQLVELVRLHQQPSSSRGVGLITRRMVELVNRHGGLGHLILLDQTGKRVAEVDRRAIYPLRRFRDLRLQLALSDTSAKVKLAFYTERQPFEHFRELGRAQQTASQLTGLRVDLGSLYRVAFILMFGAALVVATALGLIIARRTVRRVNALVMATRSVTAGDLHTHVELRVRDELGELASAFNEMVAELRASRGRIAYLEKIGAWQEIARRLAHEIKNPLTPIQLAVQQLHRKYGGEDASFAALLDDARDIITEEVDGLRRLVTAFSAFAKLPTVHAEPVDLNAMIDDFIKSHSELVERASLVWRPLVPPCTVSADRMLIKHVMVNLVENSVQAADGARRIEVEISAERLANGRAVAVVVRDNGLGMDGATVQRAFDPYYTTKEHGTGLGLAIVKKIILEHQGSIEVDKPSGVGCCFTITLPIAPDEPSGPPRQ